KQVNHDVVILLNSDVEVEKGWIKPLVKVLKSDEKNAAVQPKILSFKNKKRFEHAGAAGGMLDFLGYPFCRGRIFLETEEDLGQYDRATEIFWASGAAMCIKRQVFIDIGGFDTSFFAHMEEIDLCWRLKQAGFRIQYQPDSHVYHLGGGTLDYDSPFKVYLNFRNSLFTIFKNVSVGKLFWLLPFRLILDGIAGVFYLKQGKFRLIFMIIKAHFSFYFAFFQMISRRNDSLQLIEKCRIAKENSAGYYNKSIVFQHFIAKKNKFTDIFTN
ncbi:MAG: glycosyltransferase family 2 protein, partial [Saprospiraceae bacterium]